MSRKSITGLMLSLALCVSVASVGYAAKAKKPAVKKPASNHATMGTTQLKGEYADFGSTYTLGKYYPWNITLVSAEYSVDRLKIGDRRYIPNANEKLLVLHYKVHNPRPEQQLMRFDTLHFTVVDSKDNNLKSISEIGSEKNQDRIESQIKPAQKMGLYTAVVVPASGEMPKLMIESYDKLVLRYDLRGKVKGLPAPYADPADKTGATALEKVPAQMGAYYPLDNFDLKLDSATYTTDKLGNGELEEGNRHLVLNFTAKNCEAMPWLMRFDTFVAKLADVDGAEVEWNGDMLQASRNKALEQRIEPGQEMRFRFFYSIPSDLQPKTLTIRERQSKWLAYDVSGVN
ncbi:MAG: hypothetical protein M1133_08970 [Armatimonadetes bacterium]|nr:hypothetical protein [Armatimonadota bacterium]